MENLTGNGSSRPFRAGTGRKAMFVVTGDFGSGTVSVQIKDDNGNWVNVSGGSGTADFTYIVNSGSKYVRATLTSATSPDIDITTSSVGV